MNAKGGVSVHVDGRHNRPGPWVPNRTAERPVT
jgi:hypothetical protein